MDVSHRSPVTQGLHDLQPYAYTDKIEIIIIEAIITLPLKLELLGRFSFSSVTCEAENRVNLDLEKW